MKLETYEKLSQAVAASLARQHAPVPVTPEAKEEIRRRLFRMMRVKEEWLPEISWKPIASRRFDDVETETLRFRSWDGMYGDATLYLPRSRQGKVPAMLFSPGHAHTSGRFHSNYQIMAQQLAAYGTAVLLFDQFGLGDRAHTGHSKAYAPFTCGTTVIGLMILEGIALFNKLASDERINSSRVGIMGHSGGGQNTLFLSVALHERAALAVPSGWACSFEYNARKERHLCPCDLFPGLLHEFEVWHAIGCMYPKPILCCSGTGDTMIARDVVIRLKHRLEAFYAPGRSEVYLWNGGHSWEQPSDYGHVMDFILRNFGLPTTTNGLTELPQPFFPDAPNADKPPYPSDAVDLTQLAARLTGKTPREASSILDAFPPPDFLTQEEFAAMDKETKEYFVQVASFL
ncbi:MAG: hypothetical protein J6X55_07380 [Victivallales bacterium]|nr:hypothetical protein [Victivallales bacterium]